MIFATTLIGRPIGAFVFGHFADTIGRECMLIDGIFLGGEYTPASPLAMEYCPKEKRGLYGALIQSAAPLGTAAISLVTLAVLAGLPASGLDSPYVQWGWRIPFLVGAAMASALPIYYQRSVEESKVWQKSSRS
jgi:MFS family permease